MKPISILQPVFAIIMTSLLVTACNNSGDKKENNDSANGSNSTSAENPATPAAPATPAEKATVAFKVNDTAAATQKNGANDSEPQLGLYTAASKQLSFDLLGDVATRPHRGWLHISIENFKFEPGTYTIANGANAGFSRYTSANAGGATDYIADKNPENKGTELTISFTKIDKDPAGNGGTYLASGTFAATLFNKVYSMKRDSKEIVTIKEGTFENVPIAGGPRN